MQGDCPPDSDADATRPDAVFAHLVFVYGTLTDPQRVDDVLETDRYAFHGDGRLTGLRCVDGAYPTLVPDGAVTVDSSADGDHARSDDGRVSSGRTQPSGVDGRLLAVDDTGLDSLDAYEGVDRGLYVRVAVPARLSTIDADEVWCYVGNPDRLDAPGTWPGDGSFESRVRAVVDGSVPFVTDATGSD